MRGFLVKLNDKGESHDFSEANYLIISTNAESLQSQVNELLIKTGLNLIVVQEIDIQNHGVILLSQYYS